MFGGFDSRTTEADVALECLAAGIDAARPDRVLDDQVAVDDADDTLTVAGESYDLSAFDRLLLVGGGKATAGVADRLESLLGDRIDDGVVVVPDPADLGVRAVVGGHPIPDEGSVEGTRELLSLVESADERTLVLAAITGGGSALMAAPAGGVSLADLRETTEKLLESGATIHETNAVRKHLSAVKGGGLARAAAPATVVGVVFSDVVGSDLSVVASGPTAPDETTFADALDVLERYGIDPPESVSERLRAGARGDVAETPGADDPAFDRVRNHVLADGFTACSAAADVAADYGYETCILSSRVRGEAREAAKTHVAVAEEVAATGNPVEPPAVVVSGGETTVTVRGDGVGGPNLEFCLSAALELGDRAVVAALDTDGKDGSTDAAGAIVDADTVADADSDARRAREALADNDALAYLDERGATLRCGPTGTNVNDLRVVVVPREKDM